MCSLDPHPDHSAEASQPARPLELIEREICELAAHLAAATCRWLLLVAEFDERAGWADWGVCSCAHWLSWRCSIAPRSAREHVRVARALTQFPEVRAAFATGELSYSKVRAITRVATAETESELVEMARHATGGQLDRLVRLYGTALAATTDQAAQAIARRSLSYEWEDDGSLSLRARLPAEDGALLLAALQAAEESAAREVEAHTTTAEGEYAPRPAARRADALVSVARAAVSGGIEGASQSGAACLLSVHVDAQTLAGEHIHERSELEQGVTLAPETARRLSCDGSVVRILERDGRPLSVGRRTRTVPPALRRALQSRDRGCRFPGCTHQRHLHAHHIQHWARGGPTALANLVQLCSHHHRLVHEGGFRVESGRAGGLVFRRPDGSPIPAAPALGRARGAALAERHGALGLFITEDTCRPRSAGDRLDYSIAIDALIARKRRAT